jgi:hypothetical protein
LKTQELLGKTFRLATRVVVQISIPFLILYKDINIKQLFPIYYVQTYTHLQHPPFFLVLPSPAAPYSPPFFGFFNFSPLFSFFFFFF